MKNQFLAISVMAASMVATNIAVAQCDKSFQEVTVSGAVDTVNVTPSVQTGTIDLQLTSVKNNKVLFDQRGAIVGQITGFSPPEVFPPIVTLDHDITFDDGVEIETSGDSATVFGDPATEINVPVVEVINNFWGSKTFRKATGEMIAEGTLNVPQGDGLLHNLFDLSGTLCIKD